MAILRIQTTTAREGKTEDFNALVGEGAALMNSKGINTVVRVSPVSYTHLTLPTMRLV